MKETEIIEEINRDAAISISRKFLKTTKRKVGIDYFVVEFKDIENLISYIEEKKLTVNILLDITGDMDGDALLVFPKKSALAMCDLLNEKPVGTTTRLSKIDRDCIKEAGNVVLGNYMSVFSNRLNIRLLWGIPSFVYGRFELILGRELKKLAQKIKDALILEILFDFDPIVIRGYLLVIFSAKKIKKMLKEA